MSSGCLLTVLEGTKETVIMVTHSSCALQPYEHVDVIYVGKSFSFMFSNSRSLCGCEVSKRCLTSPLIIAQKKLNFLHMIHERIQIYTEEVCLYNHLSV